MYKNQKPYSSYNLYEKIEGLISNYENAMSDIIEHFCIKQDLNFDGWVSDDFRSGVAVFNEGYFFGIIDIIIDLEEEVDAGKIIKFQEDMVECNGNINYSNWLKMSPDQREIFYKKLKDENNENR